MVCEGEAGSGAQLAPDTNAQSAQTAVMESDSPASGTQATADCGCQSCCAPAAVMSAPAFVVATLHEQLRLDPTTPASVATEPLVPPPQVSLL